MPPGPAKRQMLEHPLRLNISPAEFTEDERADLQADDHANRDRTPIGDLE